MALGSNLHTDMRLYITYIYTYTYIHVWYLFTRTLKCRQANVRWPDFSSGRQPLLAVSLQLEVDDMHVRMYVSILCWL